MCKWNVLGQSKGSDSFAWKKCWSIVSGEETSQVLENYKTPIEANLFFCLPIWVILEEKNKNNDPQILKSKWYLWHEKLLTKVILHQVTNLPIKWHLVSEKERP